MFAWLPCAKAHRIVAHQAHAIASAAFASHRIELLLI
jgi:hypothetical protein